MRFADDVARARFAVRELEAPPPSLRAVVRSDHPKRPGQADRDRDIVEGPRALRQAVDGAAKKSRTGGSRYSR
jgi:hypothetical protein